MTWVSDDAVARLRSLAADGEDDGQLADLVDDASSEVIELPAGLLVDRRFEIVAPLARGGMGTVYRAHDSRTGAEVALKVAFALRPDTAARFAREASSLAEIRHPHVVRYIAHGDLADGDVYLAMELLDGESLSGRLARGRLEIDEVLALGVAMAAGLGALHARGLLHRDVKPSNVLLVGEMFERATIVDLGLARRQADRRELTDAGSFLGTPGYVAPEQVRGERVDARADVFALGCVLYEAVVGEPAFRGSTATDALAQILLQAAPPVRQHRPEVPVQLEALLARMLAKDPEARPADASAVLAELEALKRLTASHPPARRQAPGVVREPRTIVDSPRGRNARTRVERSARSTPYPGLRRPAPHPEAWASGGEDRWTAEPANVAEPAQEQAAGSVEQHPLQTPVLVPKARRAEWQVLALPLIAVAAALSLAVVWLVRGDGSDVPQVVSTPQPVLAPEAAPVPAAGSIQAPEELPALDPPRTVAPSEPAAHPPSHAASGSGAPSPIGPKARPASPRPRDTTSPASRPRDKASVPLPDNPG